MSLDPRTTALAQISAAVACNALASLRVAITEALEMGLSSDEIQEVISLASTIQQQPITHATHLAEQLLREPKKNTHEHSAHCGCGCHHA
ncbi:carboxymuconolactone decarboxylase family protein [Desulfosporosinus sp. PR]|uniref:carboxymuconolactone decarboxylase family protein n=1 Tax=Candidatus Desulfosporosinus nitrosoreducens TaxID=3401928 RepID=UPI0027E5D54E|nr:carboxymuconolactone decarboxylase family protein [Desulfosporosinus sp. PR]MDQ7096800.1 carboxymuconolactone decarboxylase family protein [Desulfosporosinus sp. PR]